MTLRLLGRAGCHLCDELARRLEALGVEFTSVDVDSDAALLAEFGDAVPVLLADGRELARAPIDPTGLVSALERAGLPAAAQRSSK